MQPRIDSDNYRGLFLSDAPMMDMRSPGEFAQGSFPTATSLPLMSDEERAQVGICYKQQGQAAAIALGHKIVSGDLRASRLAQWAEFAQSHPTGYLYCFRGGLRSQTVQQWLADQGLNYPLIKGGYKAMRRFLLDELEQSVARADIVLVAGKTGTGKTRVVSQLSRSIDLEGLAGHRGSTFGQLLEPQPSQIDFENALSISLMKLLAQDQQRIYLEDEGRLIGRLYLPQILLEKMSAAPMLVLEESLASRVEVVMEDYVLDLGRRYARAHGAEGPGLHCQRLQQDLGRIQKRLGGERHAMVSAMMAEAFEQQRESGDLTGHREWIATLLDKYYDPMYEYQLQQRAGKQLFSGRRNAVIARAVGGG